MSYFSNDFQPVNQVQFSQQSSIHSFRKDDSRFNETFKYRYEATDNRHNKTQKSFSMQGKSCLNPFLPVGQLNEIQNSKNQFSVLNIDLESAQQKKKPPINFQHTFIYRGSKPIGRRQQQSIQLNINQISKYESFIAVEQDIPFNNFSTLNNRSKISQVNNQFSIPSDSFVFHSQNSNNHSQISQSDSFVSYQSGFPNDKFQHPQQNLQDFSFSNISEQDNTNPQFIQAVEQKITYLKLIKLEQIQYLQNEIFKNFTNSDLLIARRFLTLTENKKKLEKIFLNSNHIVQFSLDLSDLSNYQITFNMERFTDLNWKNLSILNLQNCGIEDKGFRILSEKINRYAKIRKIFIGRNQIKRVQMENLQRFVEMKNLSIVDLYFNPLDQNILLEIQQFQSKNRQIIFVNPQISGVQKKQKRAENKKKKDKFYHFENRRKDSREKSFQNKYKQGSEEINQDEDQKLKDLFQIMEQRERKEAIKMLPNSFYPQKIQSAINGLLRYVQSIDFVSFCWNGIDFLKQIGQNWKKLNAEYFLKKLSDAIDYIWAQQAQRAKQSQQAQDIQKIQKIDVVALYKQIDGLMAELKIKYKDEATIYQLKIIKYLVSEILRSMFHFGIKKNAESKMEIPIELSKQILNLFSAIIEGATKITKHCPSDASQQTQNMIQEEKRNGKQILIDQGIKFIFFLIELATNIEKSKKAKSEKKTN